MPTYEYACKNCKTKFSISGSFTMLFSLKPSCPNCKRDDGVEKIINLPFIVFRGGGFYVNDNINNKDNK
jgi:putative FmdB family regulatory protein